MPKTPDGDPKARSRLAEGRLPAQARAAAGIIDAAEAFAAAAGLSRADSTRLRIVVEEVFANVVKHGAPSAESFISYRFERLDEAVAIDIADDGAPFDPRPLRRTPPRDEAAPNREGGQGWPLIASWSRIADYRRDAGRNRLRLIMPLGAAAVPSA